MTLTATRPRSEIDPFADEFLNDPYTGYQQLRDAGQAVFLDRYGVWVVAGYDDVREVLGDWERFSSYPNPGLEPHRPEMPQGGLLGSDPPVHSRLRKIMLSQVSPKALRALREDIERRADEHVGRLVEQQQFDAVRDLAQPFPIGIVADLTGLPQEGRENLLNLADGAFNSFGPLNERTLSGLSNAQRVFSEYIPVAMSRQSIAPGSWGAAIYDAVDAGDCDEYEAVQLMAGFVVAGMDTTIHGLGNAVWLLAQHPEAWAALRADTSRSRAIFDEALRLESPVQFFARGATRDTEIGGVRIREGERVIAMIGAANRDERHFENADTFDINRPINDHVAFGAGIHTCAGQALARMEGPAILRALAERADSIHIGGPVVRHLNNTVRGLASLPIQVSTGGA